MNSNNYWNESCIDKVEIRIFYSNNFACLKFMF